MLQEWGIKINDEMTLVEARLLPAPTLSFEENVEFTSNDGTWNYDQKHKFSKPRDLPSYAICVFGPQTNPQEIEGFFSKLFSTLNELGVKVRRPPSGSLQDVIYAAHPRESVHDCLGNAAGAANQVFGEDPALVFCVLGGSKDDYENIKMAAETDLNLMTQCMLLRNIRGNPESKAAYCKNLALKVNVKLGGLNLYMNIEKEFPQEWERQVPTMIIGFDLTRMMVNGKPADSIVAAVGSMDTK